MEVQLEEMSYAPIRKTENTTQWGNLTKCGASRTPNNGKNHTLPMKTTK